MSRTCCSRARWRGRTKSPSAPPSARAAAASSVSCSPRACCWRSPAARSASAYRSWGLAGIRALGVAGTCRGCTRSASTGSVLLFTLGLSVLSGLLFGLLPALRAAVSISTALKDVGRRIGRQWCGLGTRPEPAPPAGHRRARALGHAPDRRRSSDSQLHRGAARAARVQRRRTSSRSN